MTTTDAIAAIRKARGSLKRKPGDKPFAEEWAAYKREERQLEDAKYARNMAGQLVILKSAKLSTRR